MSESQEELELFCIFIQLNSYTIDILNVKRGVNKKVEWILVQLILLEDEDLASAPNYH